MTPQAVTALAQSDPTENLAARIGELKAEADRQVSALAWTLKAIDNTTAILGEKGLGIVVDLGPIGNAAMAARRTTEEHKSRHDHDFQLPKAV